jgi:hypothetical protein
VRLASIAVEHWRYIDGFAVSQGVQDLRTLPLDRFCSFVTWWATRNAEKESDIRQFEARLWRPVAGAEAAGPWSREAETSAFQALRKGVSG